jgi:HSP20 family protein
VLRPFRTQHPHIPNKTGETTMAKTNDNTGLGGIFSGINNLLEVVQELQKQAGNAEGGTQNFTTKSGLEGVIGVNIRTNLNGEPTVSTFGNMANNGGNPSVEPVREPMVDVLEETGHYSVIAELPGAVESSIQVTLEGQTLKLEANGAASRKYAKTLELSKAVKGEFTKSYQNGILELMVPFAG